MGNDAMVHWLSPELAWGYFLAVFVAMMGLLQVVAANWEREDLRWLPNSIATRLGLLTALSALTSFYLGYYELIFVPGPAGAELVILFSSGTLLALYLTRLLHWLIGEWFLKIGDW